MTEFKKRKLIFGDIHGCFEEFQELLDKVDYNKFTNDLVISVGDLVDRGPHSLDVLNWFINNPISIAIKGNHEDKHLKCHRNSFNKNKVILSPEKLQLQSLIGYKIFYWLTCMPYCIFDDFFIAVHAGIINDDFRNWGNVIDGEDLKTYAPSNKHVRNDLLYLRYLDKDTLKSVPLRKDFQQPENSIFWTDVYSGTRNVFYGHTVHSLDEPKIIESKFHPGVKMYGIDTGCCFGGHLTCAIIDEENNVTFAQVKAKKAYSNSLVLK